MYTATVRKGLALPYVQRYISIYSMYILLTIHYMYAVQWCALVSKKVKKRNVKLKKTWFKRVFADLKRTGEVICLPNIISVTSFFKAGDSCLTPITSQRDSPTRFFASDFYRNGFSQATYLESEIFSNLT